MKNDFHSLLMNALQANDSSAVCYTTNEQMLTCIDASEKFVKQRIPFHHDIIEDYFSLWRVIFNNLPYDCLDDIPSNVYSFSMGYPFISYPLYAVFDIDSILHQPDIIIQTTYPETRIRDLSSIDRDLVTLYPADKDRPILIYRPLTASSMIKQSQSQDDDVSVLLLSYDNLNELCFINKFNFAVLLYIEELEENLKKDFEEEAIVNSFNRFINKLL